MSRWKEKFIDLRCNTTNVKEESFFENNYNNDGKQKEEGFTLDDLKDVIKCLENGRAPGSDKMTADMINNG